MILYILVPSYIQKIKLMQNNEFQTLLQSHYSKLLIYFDLGSGQIRRIRVMNIINKNVLRESYAYFYFVLSSNSHIVIVICYSYLFAIMASWTVTNSQTSRDKVILNIYYDQCRNRTDNLKLKLNLKNILSPM